MALKPAKFFGNMFDLMLLSECSSSDFSVYVRGSRRVSRMALVSFVDDGALALYCTEKKNDGWITLCGGRVMGEEACL